MRAAVELRAVRRCIRSLVAPACSQHTPIHQHQRHYSQLYSASDMPIRQLQRLYHHMLLPLQEDLFPETFAGQPVLTASEWFDGKNAAGPKKMSMDPAKRPGYVAPTPTFVAAPAPAPTPAAAASTPAGSPTTPAVVDDSALKAALARAAKAEAAVAALEKEVAGLKVEVTAAKSAAASTPSADPAVAKELADAKQRIAGAYSMSIDFKWW